MRGPIDYKKLAEKKIIQIIGLEEKIEAQSQRIQELVEVVTGIRTFLEGSPVHILGAVDETNQHPGHWIRDEMIDRINKALSTIEAKEVMIQHLEVDPTSNQAWCGVGRFNNDVVPSPDDCTCTQCLHNAFATRIQELEGAIKTVCTEMGCQMADYDGCLFVETGKRACEMCKLEAALAGKGK